ncbi:MAG: DUF1937 family protein [Gammaproteobacteria bacterium]|jgi:hypothetical protein|nr:DUF1937 family protein [Gammaproteobacteria bacterium]
MSNKELIYLACPYSHPDSRMVQLRYAVSAQVACQLVKEGLMIFAASMHNALLATMAGISDQFADWKEYNHLMIERSDKLMVITMEGWEQSKGVQDQIQYAKSLNKPIEMIEPPHDLIKNVWDQICQSHEKMTAKTA